MPSEPLSAPPLVGKIATDPRYAEGRRAVRWIEANCRMGEGDHYGKPVRLEPFQVRIVCQLLERRPDGRRRYRRALLEMPKNNGKTPLAAWIGAYELTHTSSAVIPVAAASYEQADLLFGDLRTCVRESPTLSDYLEAYENEVQVRDGPGRAYKVAAIAGTNDGQRPSTFLADEIHEWLGNKARVHLVLSNGCTKRSDSLILNTTTPGSDTDTLAGELHEHGLRVNSGEVEDDEFLFIWYGCPEDRFDLDDPDGLRAAIRAANPAADSFLNVEAVAARFHQMPRYEFVRYHLGQWTTVADAWLPDGAWEACDVGLGVPAGADVVLAFDGSFNGDSTALIVCTAGTDRPRIDVAGHWERTERDPRDWQVDILDVEETIREACKRWQVREVAADPFRWARSLQILADERLPVVEFPQSPSRMTPATSQFYEAVVNGTLEHSGNPALARHINNCVLKVDSRGPRLTKEHKHSTRRIDLAVAAVMAHARAAVAPPKRNPRVWTEASARAAIAERERIQREMYPEREPPQ
jgi:phage terminase large subunit-like protein